jgi:hypothetical protein
LSLHGSHRVRPIAGINPDSAGSADGCVLSDRGWRAGDAGPLVEILTGPDEVLAMLWQAATIS